MLCLQNYVKVGFAQQFFMEMVVVGAKLKFVDSSQAIGLALTVILVFFFLTKVIGGRQIRSWCVIDNLCSELCLSYWSGKLVTDVLARLPLSLFATPA